MSTTMGELARLLDGVLHGDAMQRVCGAATLETAGPGHLTFVDNPDRAKSLAASPAAGAIVTSEIAFADKPIIVVDDVYAAFALAVNYFRPPRPQRRVGVCDGAWISPTARLGDNVDVYPGASIGDDVVIGAGSTIHAGVHIMAGSVIGSQTTLFPQAVLYENTRVGDRCLIHAGAIVGAYGFGYRQQNGKHALSAQLGHVEIGNDVEIGAGATIDRGTYGPTTIGDGSKIDNLVMIAHNCRIGRHNLICSQVGIAGSVSTGDYVVMAGQVGVRDHVHIGSGAVIGSKSGVSHDVAEGQVVLGQPATPVRQQKLQLAAVARLPEMRRQFRLLQRQLEELCSLASATPAQDVAADNAPDQAA